MIELKSELQSGINEITRLEIQWEENLFKGAIDSMSLVEIINLIELLAERYKKKIDMDALISEDSLSMKDIYNAFQFERL